MGDNTSTTIAAQPLFCCANCPIERRANIPPSHPLHQLLDYLSKHLDGGNITLSSAGAANAASTSSFSTPQPPQTIPGPNECAIIIISDPNISETTGKEPTFEPSRVTSHMYWGVLHPSTTSKSQQSVPTPPRSPSPAASTSSWAWKEKVDARNNVGGILKEVEGNMEGRLEKQMTGYECREHGWKFTFVVLIGVNPQAEAKRRLLEMAAQAGARDGSAEGAPSCNPQ